MDTITSKFRFVRMRNGTGLSIGDIRNFESVSYSENIAARPLLKASLKLLFVILLLFAGLHYSDSKGYFDPDHTNNHVQRKWNSLYEFSKSNNVDVLLVGNSHLYSGVNPKNLSAALGANAFVLASPGTAIADTYYALQEALKQCEPALVVVETYGIYDFNPYELTAGQLSDQFKSFSARKNWWVKACSTPMLFSAENYPYAWSNTLRNHDFIFTNSEQLGENINLIKNNKQSQSQKDELYLGRYVRFISGLDDTVLDRYEKHGPVVDGSQYRYSKYAEKYVGKIVNLCERNGIEVLFLTVPMYKDHVGYYQDWKNSLNRLLSRFQKPWFDLQLPMYEKDYPPICFENTASPNQHLTYQGSLVTSYKLARYISDTLNISLPKRSEDPSWRAMFYGEEGYFENYTVNSDDEKNWQLLKNKKVGTVELEEILLIEEENNQKNFMVKIKRDSVRDFDLAKTQLVLAVKIKDNGRVSVERLDLEYDKLHETKNNAIFSRIIRPLEIIDVLDGVLVAEKVK